MNAFQFGQQLRIKLAGGPGMPVPTASLTRPVPTPKPMTSGSGMPKPPAPPAPRQMPASYNPAPDKMNLPSFGQRYGNTLDRWYNPNTTQQVTERGEQGLMRAGQAGLGTAALAGGSALGLATMAPAVGNMAVSSIPGACVGGRPANRGQRGCGFEWCRHMGGKSGTAAANF
jgi:hypothetical protein